MSKKFGVEFSGFDELLDKLKKLEGDSKKVAEEALIETHKTVTAAAEEAAQKKNLPAGGKYSRGNDGFISSLLKNTKVDWSGTVAEVGVGFKVKENGLVSIFLMYGTPRYKKVQKLYDAFYGKKILKKVNEVQQEVFFKEIEVLEK